MSPLPTSRFYSDACIAHSTYSHIICIIVSPPPLTLPSFCIYKTLRDWNSFASLSRYVLSSITILALTLSDNHQSRSASPPCVALHLTAHRQFVATLPFLRLRHSASRIPVPRHDSPLPVTSRWHAWLAYTRPPASAFLFSLAVLLFAFAACLPYPTHACYGHLLLILLISGIRLSFVP